MAKRAKRRVHQAAAQAQQQIQAGADPEEAVSNALGDTTAGDLDAATGMAAAVAQGAEATAEGAEALGGAMIEAGQNAQGVGQRLLSAARGFAMEVSAALFGGARGRDKI